ncbi:MAG: hypothetical protein COB33_000320 [Thiotrichaceae bacterium]|nr:hypothetical protein [Thiotrichaceae bacterium]
MHNADNLSKYVYIYFLLIITLFFSGSSFAANEGKITGMNFAGATFGSHPDVVQLQIEGGFSFGQCNSKFAAIRKNDTHLISMALTAYATGKPIIAWLNESDYYFPQENRCVITLLSFSNQ